MTFKWVSNGFQMGFKGVSNGLQMGFKWVSDRFQGLRPLKPGRVGFTGFQMGFNDIVDFKV